MRTTLILLSFCLLAPLAAAQDDDASAAMMAAMQANMTPDEHHEFLQAFAGDWTYTSTMWMTPDAPPMESNGTATIEMTLGGRFLMGTHTGTMMGMPFEGRGTTGYDKASGKYLATWIDTMGTAITMYEGYVEDEKLILETDSPDPMTSSMDHHRMVQWVEGDDAHVMEYYVTSAGAEETLVMRMNYTRASE